MHCDPDFELFIYGDPTAKRNYLLKLDKEDLLVFYAGLTPYQNNKQKEGLYIIGFLTVNAVIDFNKLSPIETKKYCDLYPSYAHFRRSYTTDLVVVIGDRQRSKLLNKAISISESGFDSIGRPCQIVSKKMENLLGISGAIQRSIPPRFIKCEINISNLKELLGITP